MKIPLWPRKLIGILTSRWFKHQSACGRCGRKWGVAKDHSTPYGKVEIERTIKFGGQTIKDIIPAKTSCFPLCQQCWEDLTPEERLPYYRELYEEWVRLGPGRDEDDWEDIKSAVLEGL